MLRDLHLVLVIIIDLESAEMYLTLIWRRQLRQEIDKIIYPKEAT